MDKCVNNILPSNVLPGVGADGAVPFAGKARIATKDFNNPNHRTCQLAVQNSNGFYTEGARWLAHYCSIIVIKQV
jgi:hypothetical protein